ncbi:hypothetical protein TSAR_013927 [Trichomalopsis sarcophagae]|uniref:Uncharacterized protein n=1 Tax=Trichomalopsis sarcophagae TaxID=543379 RepID=A0A232EPM4_9HYME|nr:hypothetical protein TSAR_013927 [Trichomalopsis sarcophagae]
MRVPSKLQELHYLSGKCPTFHRMPHM